MRDEKDDIFCFVLRMLKNRKSLLVARRLRFEVKIEWSDPKTYYRNLYVDTYANERKRCRKREEKAREMNVYMLLNFE